MFLKACLNGARTRDEHPALPTTPEQVARDVTQVLAAGADAVHLHVKDDDGRDTLATEPTARTLTAVRRCNPGVPIGLTTGAWTDPDPQHRAAAVAAWTVLPDFASVNWHEAGAESIAAALLARGVGVEAGVWHLTAARAWAASPLRARCTRLLLELPDGVVDEQAESVARGLLDVVVPRSGDLPVLLHGEGSSAWPVLLLAARWGLQARIGLEDVLVAPDGSAAVDNAALVATARALTGGAASGDSSSP